MEINVIHNEDFLQGVKSIPSESIDLVVTDPPYRIISGGKRTHAMKGIPSGILFSNDGKIFDCNDISIQKWLPEVYRVLKQDTHCYIMVNTINIREFLNVSHEIGFKLHNLLVWKKNNCTPHKWYMKNAEYILFLRKGRAKKINNMGDKTIHEIKNILGNKLHPTQKPVELFQMYIENSSKEGDIIIDPFMGCGTTAIASILCNRNFIGYEIDQKYYDISQSRIADYFLNSNAA